MKIISLILTMGLLLAGIILIAGSYCMIRSQGSLQAISVLISKQQYEQARAELEKLQEEKIFLADKYAKTKTYYQHSYYLGVSCLKTGAFDRAGTCLDISANGPHGDIAENAWLAKANHIIFSTLAKNEKLDESKAKAIIECFRRAVETQPYYIDTWAKQEAKKRAYWIMAQASQGKGRSKGLGKDLNQDSLNEIQKEMESMDLLRGQ